MQGEVHKWGCDLANMHEARDKALLELERLEEVQALIQQDNGFNRHQARPAIVACLKRADQARPRCALCCSCSCS
jgi:hypothetical protein